MRFQVIDREFTAGEAAQITGVSQALQRDWRRREILKAGEAGKWARFSLTDIIEMSVKKIAADAGFYVGKSSMLSGMAILPTLHEIIRISGAVEFSGVSVDESDRRQALGMVIGGFYGGRFLLMIGRADAEQPKLIRTDNIMNVVDFLQNNKSPHCIVVDCRQLAETIFALAKGALIRIEVTQSEGAE
jgi:hypothetical protein